jgi:hypothetical protein
MLILPVVLGTLFLTFKLDQKMHGLYFMLVLQMSAPGLMSSPALAALLVHSGHQVYALAFLLALASIAVLRSCSNVRGERANSRSA